MLQLVGGEYLFIKVKLSSRVFGAFWNRLSWPARFCLIAPLSLGHWGHATLRTCDVEDKQRWGQTFFSVNISWCLPHTKIYIQLTYWHTLYLEDDHPLPSSTIVWHNSTLLKGLKFEVDKSRMKKMKILRKKIRQPRYCTSFLLANMMWNRFSACFNLSEASMLSFLSHIIEALYGCTYNEQNVNNI